jgi:hypothetical protein
VKEALERPDGEAAAWWDEICGELDWFIKNGKVEIVRNDTPVRPEEIPPYKLAVAACANSNKSPPRDPRDPPYHSWRAGLVHTQGLKYTSQ